MLGTVSQIIYFLLYFDLENNVFKVDKMFFDFWQKTKTKTYIKGEKLEIGMLWVSRNSHSNDSYQNLGSLIYHVNCFFIIICNRLSLVPFDSLGSQL